MIRPLVCMWVFSGMPGKRNVEKYDCCPEVYIDITYEIILRRKVLYYVVNMVMPCLLLSLMSMLQFSLPPDAGEKVEIGMSCVWLCGYVLSYTHCCLVHLANVEGAAACL